MKRGLILDFDGVIVDTSAEIGHMGINYLVYNNLINFEFKDESIEPLITNMLEHSEDFNIESDSLRFILLIKESLQSVKSIEDFTDIVILSLSAFFELINQDVCDTNRDIALRTQQRYKESRPYFECQRQLINNQFESILDKVTQGGINSKIEEYASLCPIYPQVIPLFSNDCDLDLLLNTGRSIRSVEPILKYNRIENKFCNIINNEIINVASFIQQNGKYCELGRISNCIYKLNSYSELPFFTMNGDEQSINITKYYAAWGYNAELLPNDKLNVNELVDITPIIPN